jgi:membrane associated rhomboid family serine protease
MSIIVSLRQYLANLRPGKVALWCYLIWYLITAYRYFDPSPAIWLNSLGISVIVGVALLLSVSGKGARPADRWQTIRLFMMPFCVSSFSVLIKGREFILIFPPSIAELATLAGSCAAFVLFVFACKRSARGDRA